MPQNGASEPGLTLPANSTIGADYDVDQTKLGELHCKEAWRGAGLECTS